MTAWLSSLIPYVVGSSEKSLLSCEFLTLVEISMMKAMTVLRHDLTEAICFLERLV